MATLESLKEKLRHTAAPEASHQRPLSDSEYSAGFAILTGNSTTQSAYPGFIIPQLTELLTPLAETGHPISVLDIGPGPQSVLGGLPWHLRCSISKYTAYEPNVSFATTLQDTFLLANRKQGSASSPLPRLENPPNIRQRPFVLDGDSTSEEDAEKFDMILFCHSMYGMSPKEKFIERTLGMLVERTDHKALVVVFHRQDALRLGGLVCHRTATSPTRTVRIRDHDDVLDQFASFIAGFTLGDNANVKAREDLRKAWRIVCRDLGRCEDGQQGEDGALVFGAPQVMVAFAKHAATALQKLLAQVPVRNSGEEVKNRQARRHQAACVVRPIDLGQVQQCVEWALRHDTGLTVLGGGHSGHCLWPNVVAVDMSNFDQIHVIESEADDKSAESASSGFLVVAGAGCTTGDIVRHTLAAGLTVPLGARPSVGAGLWLQGGIGHLARRHGLACDAIVGAVVVSVATPGSVLCVGNVPKQHRPIGSVVAGNEAHLLWALQGAGTNVGIVASVVFRAYAAPTFSVRNWVLPLSEGLDARRQLGHLDELTASESESTAESSPSYSAGAYIYCEQDKLCLGVTLVDSDNNKTHTSEHAPTALTKLREAFGDEHEHETVDSVGLFETEMYVSTLHGGHGGGKTSSFKRCLFLPRIGDANTVETLIRAVKARPSPLCYFHLLPGGGAVRQVAPHATAFGCRNWAFACVITGVWPRDQDGTEVSRAAIRWVYKVVEDLLPFSCGAYGADLGPDPRDAALAAVAFGANRPRLARIKHEFDPHHVLAFACPLPIVAPTAQPSLVILVTGESCAGKDYCADIWVSTLAACLDKSLTVRAVSISDGTKREYAAATGAHLDRLLGDRRYKEQHRDAMMAFFHEQLCQRPQLREEHFETVLAENMDCHVLLITGMREEAPVATLSHLAPKSRLLEVHVQAARQTRRARRGDNIEIDETRMKNGKEDGPGPALVPEASGPDWQPCFIFANESSGSEAAQEFAQRNLLSFFHNDLQRLARMIRPVPDFPRSEIMFRHVLDIAQQPGGLDLCTSLLQAHFTGDWSTVDVVACCEFGGFVFAPTLALRVGVPMALIRQGGKLPPPTLSVTTCSSHISAAVSRALGEKRIEIGRGVIPTGASVVVVDNVLASGTTLCAVLELLREAGVDADNVHVMVVAEFPTHRGREELRQRGFGRVKVQSLLILDGV
ncbi:hypothetical protein E4U14_008421 [Claviceps sp. LM454 group G7]|nr:hypothetical protein E4U14_008421 [Claviceps sp. LM454 group G7]